MEEQPKFMSRFSKDTLSESSISSLLGLGNPESYSIAYSCFNDFHVTETYVGISWRRLYGVDLSQPLHKKSMRSGLFFIEFLPYARRVQRERVFVAVACLGGLSPAKAAFTIPSECWHEITTGLVLRPELEDAFSKGWHLYVKFSYVRKERTISCNLRLKQIWRIDFNVENPLSCCLPPLLAPLTTGPRGSVIPICGWELELYVVEHLVSCPSCLRYICSLSKVNSLLLHRLTSIVTLPMMLPLSSDSSVCPDSPEVETDGSPRQIQTQLS